MPAPKYTQLATSQLDLDAAPANHAVANQDLTQKGHLYLMGQLGHVLTYSVYPENPMAPLYTVLRLSLDGEPFRVRLDGEAYESTAHLAVPASTLLEPTNPATVAFTFYPLNPLHRSILRALRSTILDLDRERFQPFDDRLLWLSRGDLTHTEARTLFDEICDFVLKLLPASPPIDERIEQVLKLLNVDSSQSTRDLAKAVSLSADRLTHLFTERMGIDLRRYRMSLKFGRAASLYRPGMTMTEIAQAAGFSDSPHFSRTMKDLYGASPTYFLKATQIHLPEEDVNPSR